MLRSDPGASASDGGVRAPAVQREPQRPAARATQPLHRRVSAELPRRLTSTDSNGARRWGLSAGVAVILFGFAIGFGALVVMSEHDSTQAWWRTAESSRYADEGRAAAARDGDEAKDAPSSTPTPPSSNLLIALLQQQIDSARTEDATDAETAQAIGDPSPRHGRMSRNAPRGASPVASLASGDSVPRPARTKELVPTSPEISMQPPAPIAGVGIAPPHPKPPSAAVHTQTDRQPFGSQLAQEPAPAPPSMPSAPVTAPVAEHQHATGRQQTQTYASLAPAPCGMEGTTHCKAASPLVDSHAETHGVDRTRKARAGSVIKYVRDTLSSRAAAPKHGGRTHPVERVASVQLKHATRRMHPRHVETAQQEPLVAQLRRHWRFEMPNAEGQTNLSQTPIDLYQKH